MKDVKYGILLYSILLISGNCYSQSRPDDKFSAMGFKMPAVTNGTHYLNIVRSGNLIFLSGKGPLHPDGSYAAGKLGGSLTAEQGAQAAKLCAIHQLAVLRKELGSLSKIKQIIKVTGFVNCTPDFSQQSKVMDGFSVILEEVFGDSGKHARSAVGVSALPFGWPVEVEMIIEVGS